MPRTDGDYNFSKYIEASAEQLRALQRTYLSWLIPAAIICFAWGLQERLQLLYPTALLADEALIVSGIIASACLLLIVSAQKAVITVRITLTEMKALEAKQPPPLSGTNFESYDKFRERALNSLDGFVFWNR